MCSGRITQGWVNRRIREIRAGFPQNPPSPYYFVNHPSLPVLYFIANDPNFEDCPVPCIFRVSLGNTVEDQTLHVAVQDEHTSYVDKYGWKMALDRTFFTRLIGSEHFTHLASGGIKHFQCSNNRIYFTFANRGYIAEFPKHKTEAFNPRIAPAIHSNSFHMALDNQNGQFIAFVKDRELWVASTMPDCNALRLTWVTKRSDRFMYAGTVDYVTEEEFSRRRGFFWAPKTNSIEASHPTRNVERILFTITDETDVDILYLPGKMSPNASMLDREIRYPRPGRPNVLVTVHIAEFSYYLNTFQPENVVIYALPDEIDLRRIFPWAEYVVKLGWYPDGQRYFFRCLIV